MAYREESVSSSAPPRTEEDGYEVSVPSPRPADAAPAPAPPAVGLQQQRDKEYEKKYTKPHLVMTDVFSFMGLLADLLRLRSEEIRQEQSLAMAYLYMHKYRKFIKDSRNKDDGEELSIPDFLDPHTLALASLSLSTKSTESPRRLRSLILPAYSLLHPSSPPIPLPSTLYDTLRHTLVTAELHLLRILKFELRRSLPHDYLERYISRAFSVFPSAPTGGDLAAVGGGGILEDYYDYSTERMEEDKIVELMDTGIGRSCSLLATRAMGSFSIATYYDSKTVALGVVWVCLKGKGVIAGEGEARWVDGVAGRSVDLEDFRDVVRDLEEVSRGFGMGSGGGRRNVDISMSTLEVQEIE